MKESFLLNLLYRTIPGRAVLKLLVQPKVSRAAGRFLSCGASKWMVPFYIRKHKIDMRGMEIPEGGFPSFNAFFTRKRRMEPGKQDCEHLLSPCDGFLTDVKIRKNTVLSIKNTEFSVEDLLKDRELAACFQNGTALVFRLTPSNYHRYCYAAEGKAVCFRKVPGKLHCVRPIALRRIPVFVQNSREYTVFETKNFGTMIQMEIGALLVGKIKNYREESETVFVQAGEEKGYFEFGGSTIILLFQKDKIRLYRKLFERKNSDGEIPVHMGEGIAKAKEVFEILPE